TISKRDWSSDVCSSDLVFRLKVQSDLSMQIYIMRLNLCNVLKIRMYSFREEVILQLIGHMNSKGLQNKYLSLAEMIALNAMNPRKLNCSKVQLFVFSILR